MRWPPSALIFLDQNTERKMFMFRIVSVVLATLLGPAADSLFKMHADSRAMGEDPVTETNPERFALWQSVAPVGGQQMDSTKDENAYITIHRPEGTSSRHDLDQTAVVICPGGGYGGLVVGPEGHGIAKWLGQFGITGIVLEYRLPKQRHAVPLIDAQRAVRLVRSKAAELGVREDRIGIMGFSAGGHLASTVATHFGEPPATIDDSISQLSCRPDFAVLIYPVVTMMEFTHRGSRNNLLGPEPSPQLVEDYSNERQVTGATPPIFIAHALDDRPVPIENSRMLYQALQEKKITAKLLELPSGGHGLNGYQGPMWDQWQAEAIEWMDSL